MSLEKLTHDNEEEPAILELLSKIMEEAAGLEIQEIDRNRNGELLVSPDGAISNLGKQSESSA